MKRLLWAAGMTVAIPIVFLLGLPQAWEYWIVTVMALGATSLIIWEYSLAKNAPDREDASHQEKSPPSSSSATSSS